MPHNIQNYFDQAYVLFVNNQTNRKDYVDHINSLWSSVPSDLKSSLERRKDNRSLGVFALTIYDNTMRERFLVNEWLKNIGREDVKIEDQGIANDGRLIANTNGGSGKPDYRLTSHKGDWSLEVKFCPVQDKLTFKVCDLKNYAKAGCLVLLIIGNTKMIGPNGDPRLNKPLTLPLGLKWALFGRETIMRMLDKYPIRQYREMGYKPSIQLKGNEITDILTMKDW